jgi:hypothetical protein
LASPSGISVGTASLDTSRVASPTAFSYNRSASSSSSRRAALTSWPWEPFGDGYAYSTHLETVLHLRDVPGNGLDESVGRDGLGRVLTSFRISPSGETSAAAIFVPPMSTPIAFIPYLLVP